jgi:hypothetical protein
MMYFGPITSTVGHRRAIGKAWIARSRHVACAWIVSQRARTGVDQQQRMLFPTIRDNNMNNHVGYCDLATRADNLVLGTDGCAATCRRDKISILQAKMPGAMVAVGFLDCAESRQQVVGTCFQSPFGRYESGYKADLVVLEYHARRLWSKPMPLRMWYGASPRMRSNRLWSMAAWCGEAYVPVRC